MVHKNGKNQKVIRVGNIIGKYDILSVEGKWISLIGNEKKKKPWNDSMEYRVRGKTTEGVKYED